jgi:hypothetical protein
MMPMDFLCLVDPEAKWLRSWLHAKFGRTIVFNETCQCNFILKTSLQGLAISLESQKQAPILAARGSSKGKGIVASQLHTFAFFVYWFDLNQFMPTFICC